MRNLIVLALGAFCLSASAASGPAQAAPRKAVASGETQVVARVAGREITLSELRLEMGRLGLSPADANSERVALESLANRTILAKAAREAALHRKPETIARMYAAQDQALADYYLALASQPADPTRPEIDAFVQANPSLFAERKTYEFSVLTIETKYFREDALTPLFDKEPDFARVIAVLDKAGARHTLSSVVQSGGNFPAPIREQLAKYGQRDNIVLKGDQDTQILKITAVRSDPALAAEWGPLARRLLIEEASTKRAQALVDRLKKGAEIAYYRASAAPTTKEAANGKK